MHLYVHNYAKIMHMYAFFFFPFISKFGVSINKKYAFLH